MTILDAVFECLTGVSRCDPAHRPLHIRNDSDLKRQCSGRLLRDEDIVAETLRILATAEKAGPALQRRLNSVVGTQSWTESIARAVLNGIVDLVQQGREKMGPAMAEALKRVEDEANAVFWFAQDHPEAVAGFVLIVAVGILVVMMAPWIVEALGFGELGPLEGSFAAWWESCYAGYIPKGSLFSFLQRLGMTWK